MIAAERVKHGKAGDDREHEDRQHSGFELRLLGCEGCSEDDEELNRTKGYVEEGGGVFIVPEAFENEGAESVGYTGADV